MKGRCVVASSRRKTLATAQADDLQTLLAERVEGGFTKRPAPHTPVKRYAALLQHLYREKYREEDDRERAVWPR